jgi:hypothetical protein
MTAGNTEGQDKMVLLDNGKNPDEPYNAHLGFWLPPDSPYGNFTLKLMKLCQRLDEANRRLIDSRTYWEHARAGGINAFERHVYANEQAIYLIRRTADEMIALIWCLSEWEAKETYPEKIKVDCIGALLKQPSDRRLKPCGDYVQVLKALNEISNAFKHSFVQSDISVIGRDEPLIHALSLDRNKLAAGTEFHTVSLAWLAKEFSSFYRAGMGWLRAFSERYR